MWTRQRQKRSALVWTASRCQGSAPVQVVFMKPLAVIINFTTCLSWVQVANKAEWDFCRARKQRALKTRNIKLMKIGHKWIKEALLRVFITEQMVPPGPYWHLNATYISVGIKQDSKRDFATWRLLRKQNAWLWKGSGWSLHHTREPWRGRWTALDFCIDLSWGDGKRGGVAGRVS